MISKKFFLKLRANIALPGDVDLAEREVKVFFKEVHRIESPADLDSFKNIASDLLHNSRTTPPFGFLVTGLEVNFPMIIKRLSFTQEIWAHADAELDQETSAKDWATHVELKGERMICSVPLMCAAELLSKLKTPNSNSLKHIVEGLGHIDLQAPAVSPNLLRSNSSTPHVHGLHKYKAKFFPRMIRSFLISYLQALPKDRNGEIVLLDPFAGSGTALIEGALLGLKSYGYDIDPLSCSITKAKLDALGAPSEHIHKLVDAMINPVLWRNVQQKVYSFPDAISDKFDRWRSHEEKQEFEREIGHWIGVLDSIEANGFKHLLEISLSDALTRKFNIRMMGTGVGRFALEIAPTNLASLIEANVRSLNRITEVARILKLGYNIKVAEAHIERGDATAVKDPEGTYSVILTSPPYLPASSGRENYLVSKSISITALGLMNSNEIAAEELRSLGSMKATGQDGLSDLPVEVKKLHDWLQSDPLRKIKAIPIVSYYVGLKKALKESFRLLLPGGIAFYVIGKESVFYTFKTREVLYRVHCDEIFSEIARSCGFEIVEQVDIELDKKNVNARPRGLDAFYETVFVLKKANLAEGNC
jgi:16S rRNA G966 N2-methylase RsmD